MRRKIIKQKSAYTITLPINWVRGHGLEGKEEVDLEEQGDSLVISTEKQLEPETIEFHLEESTEDYYRIMIENNYLKGYDEVRIDVPDKKALTTIQQVVSNLIGYEVIEQEENHCRISATATPTKQEFKRLLKRVLNIITYTQDTLNKDIAARKFQHKDEIEQLTRDARRFLLFCTRVLHKESITSRRDESFLHLLLERLILIQHNHNYLYRKLCTQNSYEIRKQVAQQYKDATEMYKVFRESLTKKDMKSFAKINQEWKRIYFEGHDLFQNCTKEESMITYHAMHLSKLVFLISQPNIVLQEI
jgi:phosphate uptake regulator